VEKINELEGSLPWSQQPAICPCPEPDNRFYRSADKSLARPGRKQATATEDF